VFARIGNVLRDFGQEIERVEELNYRLWAADCRLEALGEETGSQQSNPAACGL
jgi:hypothetical protein